MQHLVVVAGGFWGGVVPEREVHRLPVSGIDSIPPFGSVVFERWASRTGRLDEPVTEPVTELVG